MSSLDFQFFICKFFRISGGNTFRIYDGNICQTDWSGNRGTSPQKAKEGIFWILNLRLNSFDGAVKTALHLALFRRREKPISLNDIAEEIFAIPALNEQIAENSIWLRYENPPKTIGSFIPSHITEYCPFSKAAAVFFIHCGNMMAGFTTRLCATYSVILKEMVFKHSFYMHNHL